nr:unnamed protein product [Callosobruchus analis]
MDTDFPPDDRGSSSGVNNSQDSSIPVKVAEGNSQGSITSNDTNQPKKMFNIHKPHLYWKSSYLLALATGEVITLSPKHELRRNVDTLSAPDFNEKEDNCVENKHEIFKLDLVQWSINENIPHSSLKKLLQVINKTYPDIHLPKDPRSLLKTQKSVGVRDIESGGTYHYFGIEKTINMLYNQYNVTTADSNDIIKLAVNIDGLPLSNSSNSTFWSVLCAITSIKELKGIIFLVALFHGSVKPKHPNILLNDFVAESIQLIENRICINGVRLSFVIDMLICDVPAKLYVLQIKGHSGYFSCTKCDKEGDVVHGSVCLLDTAFNKRTDAGFRSRVQPEHHIGTSVMEMVPNFDLINNVSYMLRFLCNKKFGWVFGKPHKMQTFYVNKISSRLIKLKKHIPSDFARKTRSLNDCKRYKANEFRTFILYTGPVVLKNIVPMQQYTNFIILSVATSILLNSDYAESLLTLFVSNCQRIYGSGFISHNVHNLLHLVDCVRKFGEVGNFSAFFPLKISFNRF